MPPKLYKLYPADNVSHCIFDKTWGDVGTLKGVLETGGMGDLMTPHEWEVWVCGAQLPCAFEKGDWVCFAYNELHGVFVPWGHNRDLRVPTFW